MAATSDNRLDPHVYRLAAVIVLGVIMSILDATIVNVALETLHRELHAPLEQIQWVATGYMLALAAVIPVSGWTARRFGARRVYLVSLVLFTGGSALCGLAWSTESLIGFRLLQGVGGGMLMPVGQMILARAAGPERMGRVMSVVGVPMLLGPVFGPIIGGVLVEHASWRWIFYVNVPIGALAFTAALKMLHPEPSQEAGPLDRIGLALLALGVPAITYGLAEYGQHGTLVARAWVPLAAGAVAVCLFCVHALRADAPLLDIRLFGRPEISAASLATVCVGGALFGSMILLPLFFQTVRGQSPAMTGLLLAPQGLGAALSMPIAGKLTDRLGGGILTVFGTLVILAGTVPFAYIGTHTAYAFIAGAMVLRGIGMGFTMMPSMAAAFARLSKDEIEHATPQLNVLQRIGGSIGTALLAVILARSIAHNLAANPHGNTLDLLAAGYMHTYWYAVAATAFSILPALALWRSERRPSAPAVGGAAPVRA